MNKKQNYSNVRNEFQRTTPILHFPQYFLRGKREREREREKKTKKTLNKEKRKKKKCRYKGTGTDRKERQ